MVVNRDLEHLRLLSIFHYVVGGICILMGCVFIIHQIMGILIVTGAMGGPQGDERYMGLIFVAMGALAMLFYWAIGILQLIAGNYLRRHNGHHTFCIVAACAACLFMPIGTILGVFSIVTLVRPSVKKLFEGGIPLPAAMPIFQPPPTPGQS